MWAVICPDWVRTAEIVTASLKSLSLSELLQIHWNHIKYRMGVMQQSGFSVEKAPSIHRCHWLPTILVFITGFVSKLYFSVTLAWWNYILGFVLWYPGSQLLASSALSALYLLTFTPFARFTFLLGLCALCMVWHAAQCFLWMLAACSWSSGATLWPPLVILRGWSFAAVHPETYLCFCYSAWQECQNHWHFAVGRICHGVRAPVRTVLLGT